MRLLHVGGYLDKQTLRMNTKKYAKLLSENGNTYRVEDFFGVKLAVEESLSNRMIFEILCEEYSNQYDW